MGVYEPLKAGDTVWGPRERRGWSGSAVKDLAISENGFSPDSTYLADKKAYVSGYTTRAYEPGPIPAGRWAVELGLAAIAPPPGDPDGIAWRVRVETSSDSSWSNHPYAPVPYDPTPASDQPGWYVGDLHAHGEEEPGNATMKQTFDYGFSADQPGRRRARLHDPGRPQQRCRSRRRDRPPPARLPGQADHPRDRGHDLQGPLQQPGLDRLRRLPRAAPSTCSTPPDSSLTKIQDPCSPASQFATIQAAGGWTQINHPTVPGGSVCRGCPWDWSDAETDYSKVDAVEIQNGPADLNTGTPNPPVNPFTAPAIAFYENLLASGRHVAAVGSSDSHQGGTADGILGSPIGRAATVVHATELSRAAIVAGVKADHTYVKLYGSDGPAIRMTGSSPGARDAIFGDSSAGAGRELQGPVTGAGPGAAQTRVSYLMKLLRDGTEVASVAVVGDDFRHTFEASASGRYSLEIVRENPTGRPDRGLLEPDLVHPRRPRQQGARDSALRTGACGVSRTAAISIRFDQEMDHRSAENAFLLRRKSNGARGAGERSPGTATSSASPRARRLREDRLHGNGRIGGQEHIWRNARGSGDLDLHDDAPAADHLRLCRRRLQPASRPRQPRSSWPSTPPWTRASAAGGVLRRRWSQQRRVGAPAQPWLGSERAGSRTPRPTTRAVPGRPRRQTATHTPYRSTTSPASM